MTLSDSQVRAKTRYISRAIVADELGYEPQCVELRSDGHPYLVLKVPGNISKEKRFQDCVTVYCAGIEGEKQICGSYTGDGSGEKEDLAHEFHLDFKDIQ